MISYHFIFENIIIIYKNSNDYKHIENKTKNHFIYFLHSTHNKQLIKYHSKCCHTK